MNRPRQINYLRHELYAKQALGILMDCWEENRREPVVLIAPKGQAENTAHTIRVMLSKERAKIEGPKPAYGFTLSQPFPYTEGGVRGEAILIRWRVTDLQKVKNIFNMKGKENGSSIGIQFPSA